MLRISRAWSTQKTTVIIIFFLCRFFSLSFPSLVVRHTANTTKSWRKAFWMQFVTGFVFLFTSYRSPSFYFLGQIFKFFFYSANLESHLFRFFFTSSSVWNFRNCVIAHTLSNEWNRKKELNELYLTMFFWIVYQKRKNFVLLLRAL